MEVNQSMDHARGENELTAFLSLALGSADAPTKWEPFTHTIYAWDWAKPELVTSGWRGGGRTRSVREVLSIDDSISIQLRKASRRTDQSLYMGFIDQGEATEGPFLGHRSLLRRFRCSESGRAQRRKLAHNQAVRASRRKRAHRR
jgi:hypothetical protein